jgi:3-oxoacyl-[acyl-carrier protein] reductase
MSAQKVAVVFAGAGAIGAGSARSLAAQGFAVVVSARAATDAERVAADVRKLGGVAHAVAADALDEAKVALVLDEAVRRFGRVDTVFNAIGGRPSALGYPALSAETTVADFLIPMQRIVASQFLTAREAVKRMGPHGGSIVLLSATLSGMTARHMAGITAACGAVEALTRALAGDYGSQNVRVNCVRGSAMPETRTIHETVSGLGALGSAPQMSPPPLGRPITVAETANAVGFLASDAASGITGQVLTVCAGAFV